MSLQARVVTAVVAGGLCMFGAYSAGKASHCFDVMLDQAANGGAGTAAAWNGLGVVVFAIGAISSFTCAFVCGFWAIRYRSDDSR